jgi:hypothetical protein
MASVNTELAIGTSPMTNGQGSANAVTRVYGTLTLSGGTTAGLIIPGYLASAGDVLLTQGSINSCRGIRKILGWGFTNNTNSNAFKVVKTNDATADADLLTVTATANDSFNYWLDGIDQGQNA